MARVRGKLRCGFSTGTAATAAARAALRHMLTGEAPECVAVRLPTGMFLPVPISKSRLGKGSAWARVIKDAGDDPDVTHHAAIEVNVKWMPALLSSANSASQAEEGATLHERCRGICLVAGEGVGIVTKPGLPVRVGEPAVNPVPRRMMAENLTEEILRRDSTGFRPSQWTHDYTVPERPHVLLSFSRHAGSLDEALLEVEVRVPRGEELARHTLNPRLGIVGGISILGTTGIVKPFSHEAYKETIQAGFSVAASNGCKTVVLSTGGKSERFARQVLKGLRDEAFVQIADFYRFAHEEAALAGFGRIVLSAFFGKAIKMAQGHAYTHAHSVPLDLGPLAGQARAAGHPPAFCRELARANTAREALDLLLAKRAGDLVRSVAMGVLEQSSHFSGSSMTVRFLLFDYQGNLLVDLENQ